jgi:hypothetical protein
VEVGFDDKRHEAAPYLLVRLMGSSSSTGQRRRLGFDGGDGELGLWIPAAHVKQRRLGWLEWETLGAAGGFK